jgi:hypothetical protein
MRSKSEADRFPPSSAKGKNGWKYNSTPPYLLMTWCLIKQRDNLTLFISQTIILLVVSLGIKHSLRIREDNKDKSRRY